MKYARKLGLAVIAALALTAMLAAGSASAAETVLCNEFSNNHQYCTDYGAYAKGTAISANPQAKTTVDIENSLGKVVCSESTIGGETGAQAGEPLPVSISAWTLGSCVRKKIFGGSESCTVTALESAPYSGALTATGAGSGTLSISSGGSGNPGWTVVCGTAIDCTMTVEPGLTYSSGKLTATKAPVYTTGKFCPGTATFTGTYVVYDPSPAYPAEPVEPMTALCEGGDPLYYCEKEDRYNKGSVFTDKLTNAVFKTSEKYGGGNFTCEGGELSIGLTADYGEPLPVNVEFPALFNCSWSFGSCTISTDTPGNAGISKAPFTEESLSTGDGRLEGTAPVMTITCGSIECQATSGTSEATFVHGEPGKVEGTELKWTGFNGAFCPTSLTFETGAFSTGGLLAVTDSAR